LARTRTLCSPETRTIAILPNTKKNIQANAVAIKKKEKRKKKKEEKRLSKNGQNKKESIQNHHSEEPIR